MLRCISSFGIPDIFGGRVGNMGAGGVEDADPRQGIFDTWGGPVKMYDQGVASWDWPASGSARGSNDRYYAYLSTSDATIRGSDAIPAPSGDATILYYTGWIDYLASGSDSASQVAAIFFQNEDDITGGSYAIGVGISKGASTYTVQLIRTNSSASRAFVGPASGALAWTNPTFPAGPQRRVDVAIRVSDKYLRFWVNNTEITSGFTDVTSGFWTIACDGRIDLRNSKFGGKAANPFRIIHGSWVVYDDDPVGNITARLDDAAETMLHAVKCDVTGEDDFTPDPDPGSGLHWSNADDQNDDDYIGGITDYYTPTDVLKLAANTTGDQMGAVQTQDGGSASILGVCLFLNYTSTTGAPNLFPYDFDFLAFLDGGSLSTYGVLGYAAPTDWGWWVNLPEKPGGGNWTVSDFNNLRVGIRRTTANARDFHLRQMVAVAVGTNLAQPTPTIASPVACTVDGPVAPPVAAFVPRVSIY